ncbi:MAG: Nif3-like dinuclear metal center hexameric protein [Clostridia bacterium]|nr:Nif3-like dinuclear metal center hexameric protein [Clostridia bacterium]
MYNTQSFMQILDKHAPLSLSQKMIEKGSYDNSGLLINNGKPVSKVLFTLDLSLQALKVAKRYGCDTIVTHHPAIYSPISSIDAENGDTAVIYGAINSGYSVISMHLNLDVAKGGIDDCLCKALGGVSYKILEYTDELHGYGREFNLGGITLQKFTANVKKTFGTRKVIVYGGKNTVLNKGASFCGGGSSHALKMVENSKTDADVIVTSDMPHHVIKALVERGKCIVLLPHYTAENYGFKKYFEKIKREAKGVECFYFEDRRFV